MGPTTVPSNPVNPPPKRAVNLTAGAFTFATPSKGKGKEKDARPLGAMGGLGARAFQTPQREVVKKEAKTTGRKEGGWNAGWGRGTPIREMSHGAGSPAISISALGRGLLGEVKKEEGDDKSFKTPRKMTSLSSITAPWTGLGASRQALERPQTPDGGSSKRRRLGDLEVHLPASRVKEEKEDLGRRVALRHMGEGVRLEGVGLVEEPGKDEGEKEVGIGISPRKGKVKWTGRGEPPLALRLNALLTTQSSSLTLFYTSLQHTLHPSISSHRTHPGTTKPKSEPIVAPSTLEHIRTAPLRLRLIRPLSTREHAAQLWLASVRMWPKATTRLRTSSAEGDEEEDTPDEVIVNFSQAAKGAAAAGGAGADIKVIAGRWWDRAERGAMGDEGEEGRWEVGVWNEWTYVDLPAGENELGGEDGSRSAEKVVFVSRYLIAERR